MEDIAIDPSEFITEDANHHLKTEAFYCTRYQQVKGVFVMKDGIMMFNPIKCPENEGLYLDDYSLTIDYTDVNEANILKLVNEEAIGIDNDFVRSMFKFNFFIQVDLATVNGLTLKTLLKKKDLSPRSRKKRTTIANIFFRFTHFDIDGTPLPNAQQQVVVEHLHEKLSKFMETSSPSGLSWTFIPYYDSVLDEKAKHDLGEVEMANETANRV